RREGSGGLPPAYGRLRVSGPRHRIRTLGPRTGISRDRLWLCRAIRHADVSEISGGGTMIPLTGDLPSINAAIARAGIILLAGVLALPGDIQADPPQES